jgi:hypothetical protein
MNANKATDIDDAIEQLDKRLAERRAEQRRKGDRRQEIRATEPALESFADEIIQVAFNGSSIDGGTIQELAERHGLLKRTRMNERCGYRCSCDEHGEFPRDCFRKTYR